MAVESIVTISYKICKTECTIVVKVSTTVYKFNKKLYKYVTATIGLKKIVYLFLNIVKMPYLCVNQIYGNFIKGVF